MPLDERDVDPDPIREVAAWLAAAAATGMPNPEAMALATVGPEGTPSVRFVLLRGLDERGFAFYTSYESRKGRELAARPEAAVALYWPELGRQVRAAGPVERVSLAESESYFRSRPRGSRIAAWASAQSEPIASRAALERRVEELELLHPGNDVPLPPYWGGYRLAPREIELWEHRESRLHDRLLYTRSSSGWRLERLAP